MIGPHETQARMFAALTITSKPGDGLSAAAAIRWFVALASRATPSRVPGSTVGLAGRATAAAEPIDGSGLDASATPSPPSRLAAATAVTKPSFNRDSFIFSPCEISLIGFRGSRQYGPA